MKCNNCGAENQTSNFCNNCGAKMVGSNIPPQQPAQKPKRSSTALIVIIILVVIGIPFITLGVVSFLTVSFVKEHKDEIIEGIETTISAGYWECEAGDIYLSINSDKIELITNGDSNSIDYNFSKEFKINGFNYTINIDTDNTSIMTLKKGNESFSCKRITSSEYEKNTKVTNKNNINDIYGEFISENGSAYTFNRNTFYWYKDPEVEDDNYWYGTLKAYKYSETEALGETIHEDMGEIMEQGNFSENNIFYLELKPTKLISSGVDKSNTITDETNLNMIVIRTSEDKLIIVSYATLSQTILTRK